MAKIALFDEQVSGWLTAPQAAALEAHLASSGLLPEGTTLQAFSFERKADTGAVLWGARVQGEAEAETLIDMADAGRVFSYRGSKK